MWTLTLINLTANAMAFRFSHSYCSEVCFWFYCLCMFLLAIVIAICFLREEHWKMVPQQPAILLPYTQMHPYCLAKLQVSHRWGSQFLHSPSHLCFSWMHWAYPFKSFNYCWLNVQSKMFSAFTAVHTPVLSHVFLARVIFTCYIKPVSRCTWLGQPAIQNSNNHHDCLYIDIAHKCTFIRA